MLIKTKFSPPRPTRIPVRRENALQSISAGSTRALTLIKTPPGFGKTTLLATWREKLLEENWIVAWLTLDLDDNDASRFIDYLAGAFEVALGDKPSPEFGNVGRMVSSKVQLTSIINAVDQIGREITLILDDYDKINDPAVHDLVAFLLRHIPANLHIVAACRADPPLPLASLRARDQLVELNADSMRFGIEDTQTFFENSIAVKFSPDETRAIHEATEGWVTGLQIAALTMPVCKGSRGPISAFPHHSRALSDYLVENVLTQIPGDVLDFMLCTSVLDRLNGALCASLTGIGDAAEKLEWLVAQNMFLQPLDEDGQWYRYHGLFADFLRTQLKRRKPDEIRTIHLRAAQWLSERQLWAEAVRHAIDADRIDLAAEWLERCALEELSSSRVQNFRGWVQKLPPEALRERPKLRIAMVWALILTVQPGRARALLNEVDEQLCTDQPPDANELRRILRTQRVSILSMQDHISEALKLGKEVWAERFPDGHISKCGFDWVDQAFLNAMLHVHRKTGEFDVARQVADLYRLDPDVTSNLSMMSYRACLITSLEIEEGQMCAAARRLSAALETCEQHAGRRSAAAALLAASLSGIYYDWNRLDAVEDLLADRFDIIDDVCFIEPIQAAYLSLAKVRMVRGELDDAHSILDRAEHLAERRAWPRLTAACLTERIRIFLKEGRTPDAERFLIRLDAIEEETLRLEPESVDVGTMSRSSRARLLIQKCRFDEAVSLLRAWLASMENAKAATLYEIVQLRTLLAIAEQASGNETDAQTCLLKVLAVTEHDGVVRILADDGTVITSIFDALVNGGAIRPHDNYYENVLGALTIQSNPKAKKTVDAGFKSLDLTDEDTLSSRELDVLELVVKKLSNKQIAKTLFITPETVKWHLRNIYKKTGVSDRGLAAKIWKQMQSSTTDMPLTHSPINPSISFQ
jgi:LuxR family maltose regulon positive regulatory protein